VKEEEHSKCGDREKLIDRRQKIKLQDKGNEGGHEKRVRVMFEDL